MVPFPVTLVLTASTVQSKTTEELEKKEGNSMQTVPVKIIQLSFFEPSFAF